MVFDDELDPGRQVDDLGPFRQPAPLVGVEPLEHRHAGDELLDRLGHARLSYSDRYWWTNWTAIAPSPTAEATRLTDDARTSPTAKTPGTLVSSR